MRLDRAHFWTLNGRVPEACTDVLRWAMWFETADRHVAETELADGAIRISTVFLGIDHNFAHLGPPILYETMIFGGTHNESMHRYTSWELAAAGHEHYVTRAREACKTADTLAGIEARTIIDYIRNASPAEDQR